MSGSIEIEHEDAALRAALFACRGEPSDTPLPWDLLAALTRLVPCDGYEFEGHDSEVHGSYFSQRIDDGGRRVVEVPDAVVTREADEPFWRHYSSSTPCCYPDASGDRTSITTISDFYSEREWWAHPMRTEYLAEVRHEMMLCLDDGGSRTARLLFFRSSGHDFSERQRVLLTLLRPHVEHAYRAWQRPQGATPRLTSRQLELVHHLARGLTNRQIARELGLSEATVRTHLFNIYERLGVSSRTAAVMRVLDQSPVPAGVTQRPLVAATR